MSTFAKKDEAAGRGTGDGIPAADQLVPADPGRRKSREIGGPAGPEPTRYGDWEVGGRCTDF